MIGTVAEVLELAPLELSVRRLAEEIARRSYAVAPLAFGTNTDPYQRAEGRYALMPGIIGALTDSGTPFSILTKGTLLRRDLPVLTEAFRRMQQLEDKLYGWGEEVESNTVSVYIHQLRRKLGADVIRATTAAEFADAIKTAKAAEAYLAGRGDEVTADILKVADARAQATSRDQISKVYGSMRGKAADLIKESLPAIGATLQKHAG